MGEKEFVFVSDGNITYEIFEKEGVQGTVIDHIAYASEDIKADYDYYNKLGLIHIELGYADFLFDNGMDYFFIIGKNNEKIELCQRR